MTHENEMIRWAKCKDGAGVWYKKKSQTVEEWRHTLTPAWLPNFNYVINDEFAEIRKAFLDGERIQVRNGEYQMWCDVSPNEDVININGYNCLGYKEEYRVKPKTVKKYQVLYKTGAMDRYKLSEHYYETIEEFRKTLLTCYMHNAHIEMVMCSEMVFCDE